jgi:hypothetical protein
MNRLVQALLLGIVGLAVLAAVTPGLIKLAGALVPLVLVLGVGAAVLRCVWWLTGPR